MNAQSSGRRRQVSRKIPRSGGTVTSSPSRCWSTESFASSGCDALRDLRELVRVAEEDEGARGRADREHVRERDLARLVDEEHVDGRSAT